MHHGYRRRWRGTLKCALGASPGAKTQVPSAGGPGSFPGQGTISTCPSYKIPHDTTKNQRGQIKKHFFVVQSLSRVELFATPWIIAHQAFLSFTISWSLLKLMSVESMISSNHLILYHLLLLPSIFPSIRVFSNESVLHIRWPKYWNFSFSISLSNEYSGLISSRIDWFDLLAVQGIPKSLFQHHSSKASILQHLAFFMVQLSHPYTTARKTITLTT